MNYPFFELLTYFVIYSFAGWVMESIFRSFCEKKWINTGFLNGPFCPIYGIGAIIMYVFLEGFKDNFILLFVMSFFVLTIWEYLVGCFLEKVFQTKYWDYSDHKFNFQGRICLSNSLYWGILGIVFICFIHPFVRQKLALIDAGWIQVIVTVTAVLMLIDAIVSVIKLKTIQNTLDKIEALNHQIKEKLEELKTINSNKEEEKLSVKENLQKLVEEMDQRKNQTIRRLYRRVYRLKKAFPAIDTKEITEVLNKKIEFKRKEKENKKKEAKEKRRQT
jgi:uncharacterized membrane protein